MTAPVLPWSQSWGLREFWGSLISDQEFEVVGGGGVRGGPSEINIGVCFPLGVF